MRFNEMINKLIGSAMILGPILLVIAAVLLAADELVPASILGFYGGVLLLVAYLNLGWLVGQNSQRLGIVCLVAGFLGGMVLIAAPIEELTREMLLREGVSETALSAVFEDIPWQLALIWINGLLFPLSWVLVGAGLLRINTNIVRRWEAAALVAGGCSFFLFQGLELMTDVGLVASMTLLLVGLAPIGWRTASSGRSYLVDAGEPSPARL